MVHIIAENHLLHTAEKQTNRTGAHERKGGRPNFKLDRTSTEMGAGPHLLKCGISCICTVGAVSTVAHIRAVRNLSWSKVGRHSDSPTFRFMKFF